VFPAGHKKCVVDVIVLRDDSCVLMLKKTQQFELQSPERVFVASVCDRRDTRNDWFRRI
jgi:hypothetical protein